MSPSGASIAILVCINAALVARVLKLQQLADSSSTQPPAPPPDSASMLSLNQNATIVESPPPITPSFLVASSYDPQWPVKWMADDAAHFRLQRQWWGAFGSSSYSCADVGGNHGWYSLQMSLLGCAKTHYFEIQPSLRSLFAVSLAANGLAQGTQVVIHPLGLSDRRGELYTSGCGGLAALSFSPSSLTCGDKREVTQVSTFDAELGPGVDFGLVKIDVEGWEVQVLRGMKNTLQQRLVGALLIEIGPARWSEAIVTLDSGILVLQGLLGQGYASYVLLRGHDTCPDFHDEVFLMRGASGIPREDVVAWPLDAVALDETLRHMAAHNYDCNFWFSRREHDILAA